MFGPSVAEPYCWVLTTVLMAGAGLGKVEDEMRLINRSLKEEECTLHLDFMYWGRCVLRAPLVTSHGVVTRNDMICLVRRAEW